MNKDSLSLSQLLLGIFFIEKKKGFKRTGLIYANLYFTDVTFHNTIKKIGGGLNVY